MIEVILTLLIIAVVYAVYALWIRPIRAMKSYAKLLEAQGYKVYVAPYSLFKKHQIYCVERGLEKGEDSLGFYKWVGTNYDVVVSNELNLPLLEFYHPDHIRDFYSVDKHYQYPKEDKLKNAYVRLIGCGLLFSEGLIWKRKRSILNKIFNFDFVKSQTHKISKICSGAMQELEANSTKNADQSVTYKIEDLTVRIFSEVIMECFLGATKQEVIMGQPAGMFLKKLIDDLTIQSFTPINSLLGTKFLSLGLTRSHREIQNRVQAYRTWAFGFIKRRIQEVNEKIQKGQEQQEGYDIIEAFMRARKTVQNEKEEAISSVEEIFEEVSTFFIAGTDTTSNFTMMLIYMIVTHPEIERKVREQIDTFMKKDDYSFENLKNLTYIDLVQKQTTRCFGPVTNIIYRRANADNYINGLPVRKGTAVSIMHFGNHFSEKYLKNPSQFRPERWEKECDEIPSFVMGGFSAGARTCIGKHLAYMESKIAVVKFMKRYKKITLSNPNFKMQFKFVYGPEDLESTMLIDQQNNL